jgi:hypothetical protein
MTHSIRCCIVATSLVALASTLLAQIPFAAIAPGAAGPDSVPLPSQNLRFQRYVHDLARPGALTGMIGGSVLDQLRHTQNGPDDLGDRLGERAAHRAVTISVRHGLAALMHVSPDNHYHACHCQGFGRKVGHALLESFTAHRDDGSRTVAIPRFASAYAGSLTGLAWNHDRTTGQVLLGTTLSFGVGALMNVLKELSPTWRVRLPIVHEVVIPFAK